MKDLSCKLASARRSKHLGVHLSLFYNEVRLVQTRSLGIRARNQNA